MTVCSSNKIFYSHTIASHGTHNGHFCGDPRPSIVMWWCLLAASRTWHIVPKFELHNGIVPKFENSYSLVLSQARVWVIVKVCNNVWVVSAIVQFCTKVCVIVCTKVSVKAFQGLNEKGLLLFFLKQDTWTRKSSLEPRKATWKCW